MSAKKRTSAAEEIPRFLRALLNRRDVPADVKVGAAGLLEKIGKRGPTGQTGLDQRIAIVTNMAKLIHQGHTVASAARKVAMCHPLSTRRIEQVWKKPWVVIRPK